MFVKQGNEVRGTQRCGKVWCILATSQHRCACCWLSQLPKMLSQHSEPSVAGSPEHQDHGYFLRGLEWQNPFLETAPSCSVLHRLHCWNRDEKLIFKEVRFPLQFWGFYFSSNENRMSTRSENTVNNFFLNKYKSSCDFVCLEISVLKCFPTVCTFWVINLFHFY